MPLAIFGITSNVLNLVVTFALLGLVAIWIALIVFTFNDARRRISDPFLVACATAASFFPFIGTVIYTIVYYVIGDGLIAALIAGIIWLLALQKLYTIGWLKSLLIAIVVWIVTSIVGWLLPTLTGPI